MVVVMTVLSTIENSERLGQRVSAPR